METSEYRVEGMGCEGCIGTVTDALKSVEGVHGVRVDLEAGTATVETDAGVPPFEVLASAVADAGYSLLSD